LKKIRRELENNHEAGLDDIYAAQMIREVRRVLCAPRPFLRVPSPGPHQGLFQKTGLVAGDFLAKILREAEAPAEPPRRGGCPGLPEKKKRSATEGRTAVLPLDIISKSMVGVL
jgi:hypothetical protein